MGAYRTFGRSPLRTAHIGMAESRLSATASLRSLLLAPSFSPLYTILPKISTLYVVQRKLFSARIVHWSRSGVSTWSRMSAISRPGSASNAVRMVMARTIWPRAAHKSPERPL